MVVLVRKMVVIARRCNALFFLLMSTVSFVNGTVLAKGNASKSICREGDVLVQVATLSFYKRR